MAADIVAFMDALKIPQAVIGGFDWGARTACVIAALWPQRCKALVSVSGYLIVNLASNLKPLAPQAELGWWYQYYFSTPRGELGYRQNTCEFNRLIWSQASPPVEIRRRDLRSVRCRVRQSGSRGHRHPQLPVAAEPGPGRAAVRRGGSATCRHAADHGAGHHDRQRFRRPRQRRQRLPPAVHRPIRIELSTG